MWWGGRVNFVYCNIILSFYNLFKLVLMKFINAFLLRNKRIISTNIMRILQYCYYNAPEKLKIQFRKPVVFFRILRKRTLFFLGYPTPSTPPIKYRVPCLTSSVYFLATALANSIILACRQRSIVCWLIRSSVSTMMLREFPRDCIDDVKIWSTREQTKWVFRWCSYEMAEDSDCPRLVAVYSNTKDQ